MTAQRAAGVAQDAEEVARRVRGVRSVRAEAGDNESVSVIHVLADADRSPKLVAMDVAAALAAELGMQVDPRQIRVASMRDAEAPSAPPQSRLKFVGLTVTSLRNTSEVKVHLEDRGLLYEGIASGASVARSRYDLVAQASLRAVEVFLRANHLLVLDGVQVTRVGERDVAVAVVTLSGQSEELLSGSSVVRDDPREAVVRAVLDAVNRPIGWLASGRPA